MKPLQYVGLLLIASISFFLLVASIEEFHSFNPYFDLILTILITHLVMTKIIEIKK